MTTFRSRIISSGSYLPERILTNADLEKMVDTSDEWITKRSGIKQRHIAADDEFTSDMAVNAAKNALDKVGLKPEDIDGIIVATTTPDKTFPSTAVLVQAALGVPVCTAFDVQAVCTGFVYAMSTADNFIRSGQLKRVLVIGAEKMSSVVDWTDRTTCVLFADGAGAVILESTQAEDQGILSSHLYANGAQSDLLYTDGGTSTTQTSGHIIMHGKEVFKYAVEYMANAVSEALVQNNLTAYDIDLLVPHQANIRIIKSTAKKLGLPIEKVMLTVERHGNTSAASIPLAFDEAMKAGKVKDGDLVLFEAMGGGLTWGSCLVRM